jgi:hypothetical protein
VDCCADPQTAVLCQFLGQTCDPVGCCNLGGIGGIGGTSGSGGTTGTTGTTAGQCATCTVSSQCASNYCNVTQGDPTYHTCQPASVCTAAICGSATCLSNGDCSCP